MAVGETLSVDSVDPGLIRTLTRHLEHLKSCPEGGELCQLINDALLYCREHGYVNGSSIAYLYSLLLAYTQDHSRPSATRIRARLIQQHLSLYLPHPDRVVPEKSTKPAAAAAVPDASRAAAPVPAAEPAPNLGCLGHCRCLLPFAAHDGPFCFSHVSGYLA